MHNLSYEHGYQLELKSSLVTCLGGVPFFSPGDSYIFYVLFDQSKVMIFLSIYAILYKSGGLQWFSRATFSGELRRYVGKIDALAKFDQSWNFHHSLFSFQKAKNQELALKQQCIAALQIQNKYIAALTNILRNIHEVEQLTSLIIPKTVLRNGSLPYSFLFFS